MTIVFSPEMRRIQNHIRGKIGVPLVPDPDTELHCHKCGLWKPDEMFYNHGDAKPSRRGRRGECKECTAAYKKVWRMNPENRLRENNRIAASRRPAGASTVTCVCGMELTDRPNSLSQHRKFCQPWLDSQKDV